MASKYDKILDQLRLFTKDELATIFDIATGNSVPNEEYGESCDCPYCQSENTIRYGKKHGKQRFRCKACRRTFLTTTNTVMYNSHYGIDVWESVLDDTIDGNSIDYSAKRLGISHQTAFNMRHKLLLALEDIEKDNPTLLSEVSELDETFVLDCFKGKELPFELSRPARKHGAKAKKRGISNEYVCICTGVERGNAVIAKSVNRAKPNMKELEKVFSGHISDGTLLLTDGLRSYNAVQNLADCIIKNVNAEHGSFYNLNATNGLHSFIKRRYCFYRGVATKYLNRYCMLFAISYRRTKEQLALLKQRLFNTGSVPKPHTVKDVWNLNLLTI